MRKSKSLYVLLLLMIAVVMCGTAALGVTLTSQAVLSKGLSTSADEGIMPFGYVAADPVKDTYLRCSDSKRAIEPILVATPWESRIEAKLHLANSLYIYVNLDTRHHAGMFKEDIIVEFRAYNLINGKESNAKIEKFYAYIEFTSDIGLIAEASCTATNTATGGFTRSTTFWHTDITKVWLTVDTTEGHTRTAYFEFNKDSITL